MSGHVQKTLRLALIQLSVTANKQNNLNHARKLISEAATKITQKQPKGGAPLVVLPECFNSPYGTQYFPEYAEEIPGATTQMLSEAAKSEGVYLIGGSIPERRGDKLFNTSTAFNPNGEMIMKYSKTHLFDIDIPGKIRFQESEVLTAGESLGMFDISPDIKIGLGICYDIRFAELSMLLTREGCNVLLFPGAFNMTTGPAHWELIQRGRAVDNQVYVATCSPARDMEATYNAWGHSTVVDPWGTVIAKVEDKEEIIYTDIDIEKVQEIRQQVPIHHQRRQDIYRLERTGS